MTHFWALQLHNNLPQIPHLVGRTLTITKVILDPTVVTDEKDTIVRVTAEGRNEVIIAIVSKVKRTADVFVKFDGDRETEFLLEGKGRVHISGFTEKKEEVKDGEEDRKKTGERSGRGTKGTLKRPWYCIGD